MAAITEPTQRTAHERTLRTFLPLAAPPDGLVAGFRTDPARWLPDARRDGDAWTIVLRAGALSRVVRVAVGAPWQAGDTTWRTLSWDPVPVRSEPVPMERLLPTLDGELGLHRDPGGRTTLVLDARYRPPGGALGAAVDAMALHRVARDTVERFLGEVGPRLAAEAQHLDVGDVGS